MNRLVVPAGVPDWLAPHLRWITLPSWVLSLAAHVSLWGVLLVVSRLPGCQPDAPGAAAEELRAVGLSIRPVTDPSPTPAVDSPAASPAAAAPTLLAPAPVPDEPPVALSLPTLPAPAVIGAGGPPRSVAGVDDVLNPTRASRGGPTASGAGGTDGATTFLGITDSGQRFVYLIDASSSMSDYGALRVAKSELLASLERLQPEQQFQVLFATSERITTLDAGRFGVFRGNDISRLDIRQQIAAIHPDAGTNHFAALQAALKHEPDVLFYLSDAGQPPLNPKQLEEITRLNRDARIHCIEFGLGPVNPDANGQYPPNFLTKLAAQNDGRYTYRDVTRFAGR